MSPERRPTERERAIAHNLERVTTADYLSGRMTLEEFNFLNDRLHPYTKLDLRQLAAELDVAEYRAKRERVLRRIGEIKSRITGIFRHESQTP
jgi:7,8-dihydro-6-hydroxymethylpterin-pyrophosphokinase